MAGIRVNAKILAATPYVAEVDEIKVRRKVRARESQRAISQEQMYALWGAEYDDAAKLLKLIGELRKRPSVQKVLDYLELNYINKDLQEIAEHLWRLIGQTATPSPLTPDELQEVRACCCTIVAEPRLHGGNAVIVANWALKEIDRLAGEAPRAEPLPSEIAEIARAEDVVERVARALCIQWYSESVGAPAYDSFGASGKGVWLEQAKAALRAATPSPRVTRAGLKKAIKNFGDISKYEGADLCGDLADWIVLRAFPGGILEDTTP